MCATKLPGLFLQCTTWARVTRIGGTLAPDPLSRSAERHCSAGGADCERISGLVLSERFPRPRLGGSTMTPPDSCLCLRPVSFPRETEDAGEWSRAGCCFVCLRCVPLARPAAVPLAHPLAPSGERLMRPGPVGRAGQPTYSRLWGSNYGGFWGFYGCATRWLVSGLEGFVARSQWGFRQQLGLVYNRHPEEVGERAPVGPREPA